MDYYWEAYSSTIRLNLCLRLYYSLYILFGDFFAEKKKSILMNLVFTGIVALISSLYFLFIFHYAWIAPGEAAVSLPSCNIEVLAYTVPSFGTYGFLLLLPLLGIVLTAGIMLKGFNKEKNLVPYLFAAMIIISLLPTVFGERACQQRFAWPIYFGLFFGVAIYFAFRMIKIKHEYVLPILSVGLAILFIFMFKPVSFSTGLMDQPHWDAFEWIRDNTEPDATVLFFYGDTYNQNAQLPLVQRTPSFVGYPGLVEAIQAGKIQEKYSIRNLANDNGGLTYRTGPFSFNSYLNASTRWRRSGNFSLCDFDYILTDKVSRQPIIVQYSAAVFSDMVANEWIEQVFENEVIVILKNNNPGEVCIEERTLA